MTQKLTRRAFAEAGTAAALTVGSLAIAEPAVARATGQTINAGLIGLDTSHVPGILDALAHAKPGGPLDGVKVVAAGACRSSAALATVALYLPSTWKADSDSMAWRSCSLCASASVSEKICRFPWASTE